MEYNKLFWKIKKADNLKDLAHVLALNLGDGDIRRLISEMKDVKSLEKGQDRRKEQRTLTSREEEAPRPEAPEMTSDRSNPFRRDWLSTVIDRDSELGSTEEENE